MSGPYKMKGSPMARNFGTPFRKEETKETKKKKKEVLSKEKVDDVSLANRKLGLKAFLVTYKDGTSETILTK